MSNNRAPKQWKLSTVETLNSFTNWKENLCYVSSLDTAFAPYLRAGVTWRTLSAATPTRGFTDDAAGTDGAVRRTKEDKCTTLNLMLGQIANYATVISRNQIIKSSTSLNDIWDKIRHHYGFHTTGSRFLDLSTLRLETGERAEDLYQRIVSFIDDNLLTTDSTITHHSAAVTSDEEVSPSLENVIVLLWLERLHVGLPALVKQRYGAELRNKTIASIKPEISQALPSLLEELSVNDGSRVMRTQPYNKSKSAPTRTPQGKYCCLCRTANRANYNDHYLSQCPHLPKKDRERWAKIRLLEAADDEDESADEATAPDEETAGNDLFVDPPPTVLRRVRTTKLPRMKCFYGHVPITLVLDSGAESNIISEHLCLQLGLRVGPTNQGAQQVDNKTSLPVVGEIGRVKINKGSEVFELDALVVKDDIGEVIAGEPFLEKNDIALRAAKRMIIIKGRLVIPYAEL